MMKARVKYPTEEKKNTGKKTVTAGTLSNGEIKCNGNATTEPPKVDHSQPLEQRNIQTERTAPQIGELSDSLKLYLVASRYITIIWVLVIVLSLVQ